jgi:hypothetical protein
MMCAFTSLYIREGIWAVFSEQLKTSKVVAAILFDPTV